MTARAPSFLPGIVAALLCAACTASAQQAPAATTVQAAGDAVVFVGQINPQSAAEFLRLLREDAKITRLVISSRGGQVTAALDMAQAVHERQLDVEVPSACWSSCANYVFPAGHRKTIGRPGAVAWHGNMTHVMYLQQTGQPNWSEDQIEGARQLARREADFYGQIGVDGFVCWFAKIGPYNVDDFYFLSVPDMERFGIRGVTLRASASPPESRELSKVLVDWSWLEATRPLVRLDP